MIIYEYEDIKKFKDWIELNLANITWEGRYERDFNDFWGHFFVEGLSLSQLMVRFEFAKQSIKTGPLQSWFNWLKEKLFCYTFIYKNATIEEIAKQARQPNSYITLVLRDFFIERYPYLEDKINDLFMISDITSKNLQNTYADIVQNLTISKNERGSLENDIMKDLEVTLYPEWNVFIKKMKRSFFGKKLDFNKIKERTSFKKQMKFLQEIAILFIIGGSVIFLLKVGNRWYEDYLVEKVSLYEPNFFWLDKSLTFKTERKVSNENINLSLSEIENLEKKEAAVIELEKVEEERYDVESDVILASVDTLPKDISDADSELSAFEEKRKGGHRDSRYGRRKAYRIMMNSVSPRDARDKVKKLMVELDANPVGTVKPGIEIPGGVYFNLFVPNTNLTNFLTKVAGIEETTVYISKTRTPSPRGLVRVFVWIKEI